MSAPTDERLSEACRQLHAAGVTELGGVPFTTLDVVDGQDGAGQHERAGRHVEQSGGEAALGRGVEQVVGDLSDVTSPGVLLIGDVDQLRAAAGLLFQRVRLIPVTP